MTHTEQKSIEQKSISLIADRVGNLLLNPCYNNTKSNERVNDIYFFSVSPLPLFFCSHDLHLE